MAIVNVNATIRKRFEAGGTLLITPDGSASDFNVLSIIKGTLNWTPGGHNAVNDMDAGAFADTSRQLDPVPTTLEFDIAYTSIVDANELYKLLTALPTNGLMAKGVIAVSIFDSIGEATGEKVTFRKCVFGETGFVPSVIAGEDSNILRCSLQDYEAFPLLAAF